MCFVAKAVEKPGINVENIENSCIPEARSKR